MKIFSTLLFAALVVTTSAPLAAETIVFSDRTKADVEKASLSGDTIFQVVYSPRNGRPVPALPWTIQRFFFDKRAKDELEARKNTWNDILRKYSLDKLGRTDQGVIEKNIKESDGIGQLGRNASESAKVWMHAAHVRVLARHGETDKAGQAAFEKSFKAWEQAVKDYIPLLDKIKAQAANRAVGGKGHGLSQITVGRVHRSAFDVWKDCADYYIRAKLYAKAWPNAGAIIAEACSSLERVSSKQEYLTKVAMLDCEWIANRVIDAARVADEKSAKSIWQAAETCFEGIAKLAPSIEGKAGKELGNRAKLSIANCQIWTGKTSKAKFAFERYASELDRVLKAGAKGPQRRANGSNAAPVAALAINGLGKIAYVKGDYDEALRSFSRSITNFSADRNLRAEAVLFSGLSYAKMAAGKGVSKSAKKYLLKMAEASMTELSTILANTTVFSRRALLDTAIKDAE